VSVWGVYGTGMEWKGCQYKLTCPMLGAGRRARSGRAEPDGIGSLCECVSE
jgi:hypothetical protein